MRELLVRASASRPLWIGVLDVVTGLLLIQFLLDGRHLAAIRAARATGDQRRVKVRRRRP